MNTHYFFFKKKDQLLLYYYFVRDKISVFDLDIKISPLFLYQKRKKKLQAKLADVIRGYLNHRQITALTLHRYTIFTSICKTT